MEWGACKNGYGSESYGTSSVRVSHPKIFKKIPKLLVLVHIISNCVISMYELSMYA